METTKTEPLTRHMISTMRAEAGAAGDWKAVAVCDCALIDLQPERERVAEMINAARAMDDDAPFVRVVP